MNLYFGATGANLGWKTGHFEQLLWFPSVRSGKCRNSTSYYATMVPANSFLIHYCHAVVTGWSWGADSFTKLTADEHNSLGPFLKRWLGL
jgi:hypothetical protein